MKKLILVALAVALVGALVAILMNPEWAPGGGAEPGDAGVSPAAAKPEPVRAPDEVKKPRVRSNEEQPVATLSVAGVVTGTDGLPVAGAVVDAFAVPEGDDVPDEERLGLSLLTKAYGKAAAERLMSRGKSMRNSATSGDPAAMGDLMQDGMDLGLELLSDEGGLDGIQSLMRMGRELLVAADGDWPIVGSVSTAADGTFRVEGLAAGRVELRAKAPQHVKTKVRATAGDASVSIRLVRGVRLAGSVTCAKEPVIGASVVIAGAETKSGAGGRFEFEAAHLPSETMLVTAQGCVSQGRTLSLTLDGPNADVEIVLDPAGSAAGRVSAIGGGPIEGARVALAGSGNIFADMMGMGGAGGGRFDVPPALAVTDAQGAFEMHGIPTGATKLRVEADGWLGATVSIDVKRDRVAPVEALLLKESVLTGTVRDAKGAPLAGAKVRVAVPPKDAASGMMANMLGGTFRSGLADAEGRFEVHGLAEGTRKVRVEAAKHLTFEDEVELPAQSTVKRDFALNEGYRISGTVAGPDGKPFAGAKVYVTGKPAGGSAGAIAAMFGGSGRSKNAAAESGADGTWSADGLPEGPYEVTAKAEGFLDAEAKDIEPARTDVALALRAAATIRGRVLDASDGLPIPGASVQRKAKDASKARGGRNNPFAAMMGSRGASVTTDAEGAFEIKSIEPGGYDLTASLRGYADSAAVTVNCAAGETTDGIEILLPAGVDVAGRVIEKATGAGVPGAVVWSVRADAGLGGFTATDFTGGTPQAPASAISATSDADGRFVLEGLSPGKITLEVRVADHAPATAPGVTAPSTDVVVSVTGGGFVAGRVTGADGASVGGATVMMMRGMMGQGARQAKTDADGEYRFERLPAGAYQIMLLDPTSPMMSSGMASVTVRDGETTQHDFAKKSGGRAVGGDVSKDGKPLANAPVMLMGGGGGMKMATTDEKGHFSFDGLEPGDYTVLVQSAFVGGGTTSKKVTVGADGKLEDVRLELSSAKIEGDVVDAETGKGVPAAQVQLTEIGAKFGSGEELLGTFRGQAICDERGHFLISDVQAGSFTLRASAQGYPATTMDGVASGAQKVRVEMRRGVEFPVTVTGPGDTPVANAMVQSVDSAGREAMAFDMTMSSITQTDGVARLRLAPGRYTLKVTATNFLPAQVEIDTVSGSAAVRLDAGATVEVVATGPDGTTPLANARVKLFDAAGVEMKPGLTMESFMGGGAQTDAEGRWSRQGVPPGEVVVVVTDAAGKESRSVVTLEMNRTRRVDVSVK